MRGYDEDSWYAYEEHPDADPLPAAIEGYVRAQVAALTAEVREYRNAITWNTTCVSCSKLLDSCYAETVRAEKAEAERDEHKSERYRLMKLISVRETEWDALRAKLDAVRAELHIVRDVTNGAVVRKRIRAALDGPDQ
jgi:hypothetical protein